MDDRGARQHRAGITASGDVRSEGEPGNWLQRHPRLVDGVVTLAVFTYNLPILPGSVPDTLPPLVGVVVSLGLCLPFLLRRTYPLATFLCILLTACLQLALGMAIVVADIMLLLALYTVAALRRWYVSAPAGLAVVGWLLTITIPTLRQGYLNIGDVGVLVGAVIWAWTWGRFVRIRRRYVAGLRQHAVQLEREREARAAIAAAEERARIAREIHDIVSHSLSAVVVVSEGAAAKVESEPERARTAMLSVRDTGRAALVEMRRMLDVLRDEDPGSRAPQPGISLLPSLIEDSRAAGMPVTSTIEGTRVDVPVGLDLTVYRIVQEALTNVRRHAGDDVTDVRVRLHYRADAVTVRVSDDGRGRGRAPHRPGHGLNGMRERVTSHGGTLHTGPRTPHGYQLEAILPLGDRE